MSQIEINRQRQRLDSLFSRAKDLPDPEVQSHWSRYLCVLVSGFLENAVRLTFAEYARTRSDPSVADFVESRLRQFQNPRMDSILKLAGSFSREWGQSLAQVTNGRLSLSDAVNSIVGNRHKIAHGESVQLTLHSLKVYYGDAIEVVRLLRRQCGLQPPR